MSEFTSGFWSPYIAIITLASVIGCAVFLKATGGKRRPGGEKLTTTGHAWDEDLQEWNNPLPKWWTYLFYLTVVFGLVYLLLYPGLGSFPGLLGWTSVGQYEREREVAAKEYDPIYEKFSKMDIPALAENAEAREMGQRLFLTYCYQCHGSDGRGARGFPNLTDGDWLYGGSPEAIQTTILDGRHGIMPPMIDAVGGAEGVKAVANYVREISGQKPFDPVLAAEGKEKFVVCAACHGPDGKGNPAIGAPNLTDNIWLYGGSLATITETVTKGRNNQMPAWKDLLGETKVHILAAYVYSLSQQKK
ncbi:MAG: cytochrome-c oxidase, cbb3-type subunit III [Betaproteobacteria bacterium]|nr:cytochrome-c oxidase, cbb3-type subunit III [Betaproteobacteria bacterium]